MTFKVQGFKLIIIKIKEINFVKIEGQLLKHLILSNKALRI